ncbi:unnamed protein product, partial [Polarella glacialis]
GDGDALLRAFELGLARSSGPLRPGVWEQLEAAKDVLGLVGDEPGAVRRLGLLLEASPTRLLHLFRAAKNLRAKDPLRLLQLVASNSKAVE